MCLVWIMTSDVSELCESKIWMDLVDLVWNFLRIVVCGVVGVSHVWGLLQHVWCGVNCLVVAVVLVVVVVQLVVVVAMPSDSCERKVESEGWKGTKKYWKINIILKKKLE